ncbi:radical SAM protein [Vulgatibacter sp.]|uniref:radical SAM protein n=1 Tax=Vulgatibacter sp. TaxID=1971226 RepID=UPI003564118D
MATSWELKQQIEARLADEQGTLIKDAPVRVALCYPSPYHVAMSSLGFQTIYREIHQHPAATAERSFLPDDVEAWRASRTPLFTYESGRPVSEHDIVAFSVAYEIELVGLLDVLDLSGLPVLREERGPEHPLVVAGGPLTFSNPVTMAPFVDVVVMGEAEETIHALLAHYEGTPDRERLLDQLAALPGFWVPSRSMVVPAVGKAEDARLPARSQIITPHTELRSMYLIEAERGCSRGCTYCVMRRTTNGGMRTVTPERVLELIPAEARRVGLVGAAVTDHPKLPKLLRTLVEDGRSVSISSLRANRLTDEIVGLLRQSGAKNLTTASDGASERLRDAIDRKTKEKDLLNVAELCRKHGYQQLKLYLMVGLPGETQADLDELLRFGTELSKIIPLAYGCAPFVAKRNTPMDGAPFEGIPAIEKKLEYLRRGFKGRVDIRATSARWAWVEYMVAQGDERAGLAAMDAWKGGGSFAAWKRAFKERGVQPHAARRVEDGRLKLPTLAHWPQVAAPA